MTGNIFIIDFFLKGGITMIPLLICSILALAVTIGRVRYFLDRPLDAEKLMKNIRVALNSSDVQEAVKISRQELHPLGSVLYAGLTHLGLPRQNMLDHMREEALRQLRNISRHNSILSTIAGVSPLLGLTGTILGMITSFSVISTIGIGDPTALAGGISEALYTTAAGLFVGIPSLVVYNWCENKVAQFEDAVEYCSLDLANSLPPRDSSYEKASS
ncbi:MAG: MotA/TolQ/ExbB proton channel family protein [Candidatus Riflebacteria bacterium]|nr:MotA/TolQ/ExbB proton channel family protein [Candidatus Riflebacteria bacterium]